MSARKTDRQHSFEYAANIPVGAIPPQKLAAIVERGWYRVPVDERIVVLDVICANCRQPWDTAVGRDCEAAEDNSHLIGGRTGERAKRDHDDPGHSCLVSGCDDIYEHDLLTRVRADMDDRHTRSPLPPPPVRRQAKISPARLELADAVDAETVEGGTVTALPVRQLPDITAPPIAAGAELLTLF